MPAETHAPKIVNRAATVSPAAAARAVQCQPVQNRIAPRVQASLKVSSPKDPAEQEADATARQIVRMPTPDGSASHVKTAGNGLQCRFASPYISRFADSGIFTQRTGEGGLFRKAEGETTVSSSVAADIQGSGSSGSPLPPPVRQYMEPRFQADFSSVRIHTDDKAAGLNRQLGAQAFAVGNNVFFGRDKFQPGTSEGKELIAHELTHTVQQGAAIQRRTVDIAGKRMYVTSDGKTVELPPDMTDEQATKLEAEARTAQKKLGKGPPPRPVPDVRKLARKEAKKERARPASKGKRRERGRGASKSAGAAVAGLLRAVGSSKVAQYLAAKGAAVLGKGIGMLQKLKQNEQTHDDAVEKLSQSEKAVVIPPSEGQAKSNTGQVNAVSGQPAPAADEKKGKQRLQESLQANVPQSIEDVDNFKRDRKAQHMGADVMMVVQSDKNAVVATFGEMEHTPPPAPPEHAPESLPAEEAAPATATMNLGAGAIAPPLKEHTDVSNYTKEADSKLKEEGVTQEQLDMVDSGDLAEANKEKKGMEKTAKTAPQAMQQFARQAGEMIDQDLRQEEKKGRDGLAAKRKAGLGATAQKQKAAKSALEKKREEVAAKINGMFKDAQDKVKKKLADLETESMKRFDDGNAKATKEFEDSVNREIDAFKADRYSGFFGGARRAKDWLLGMDDLPEVKAIFDRNRATFVSTVNKLVDDIAADNKRVIQECKDELANARKGIQEYVDKLGPELKDIGKSAAEEMNAKLNELDQFVGQKEQELGDKLKDRQQAAIKAIDEKIEKMKEAMSGALSKLGKLLLLAAKKFFTWALEKFGCSMSTIEGVISKGAAVLKAIFTQPIQFVKNLMKAAITGFENFGKNFLAHLKNALFEWLTGSLQGLVLPKTWDFAGIVGVALQMIGISYQNIRTHMVTVMGEPVVAGMEKTFTLVQTLVTEGPMAAWEQLKEMAGEMRDAFIDAVKDFIKIKIVEQAITWVVSLFIPGAGIVKAIIGIYDTIVFFIQKAKQIMQMIANFLGSIAEIAAGNVAAAADAMEKGLARGLSLVISFLAALLRLSGITGKIRDAIQKIRAKVDAVLLKVAKWIAAKAKQLWGGVKAAAGKAVEWWKQRRPFKTQGGDNHELYYSGEEKNAVLMVASNNPKTVPAKLAEFDKQASGANASEEERQGKALIAQALNAAKNEPNDPNLTGIMQQLIQTYDEGGAGKKSTTIHKTGTLGGNTVGLEMTVDWLGAKHPEGTTPESGVQDNLMGLLVTDPSERSPDKYIRGHLLNHHLGGRGNDVNMFPITGNANKQHLVSTETRIKTWAKIPKRWIRYEVKVRGVSSKLDAGPKNPANFVNSTFACHAILKDAAGKSEEEFSSTIHSIHKIKVIAGTTEH